MWALMERARDAFAAIDGVQSCRIGIEDSISPADFPLIRIVPETYTTGRPYGHETAKVAIVFGLPIADSEGMELAYEQLHTMRDEIKRVIREQLTGRYLNTDWFDKRGTLPYKLAAVTAELWDEALPAA